MSKPSFLELQALCKFSSWQDPDDDYSDAAYDKVCRTLDRECSEDSCPVWRKWFNQLTTLPNKGGKHGAQEES